MNPESEEFQGDSRPTFYIGQHDSTRSDTLSDLQYGQVLNAGFSFVTTPITNIHFHQRIRTLVVAQLAAKSNKDPDPIVTPLTTQDTSLFPSNSVSGMIAYSSPWIDLCSQNPVISTVSRQVLNLEVAYANFCGVRTVIVPGPRQDVTATGNDAGIVQYARAIQEALTIASRTNVVLHVPMYREPELEEAVDTLSALVNPSASVNGTDENGPEEIDLFGAWDSWHLIRTVCAYNMRLGVAVRIPRVLPEKELQTRWFSEPLHYITFGPKTFATNKAGHPSLSRFHQDLVHMYMRLKNRPMILLYDIGPGLDELVIASPQPSDSEPSDEFPTLAQSHSQPASQPRVIQKVNPYAAYMRHVEFEQEPFSSLENSTLIGFQDWLQSPLQPLSDNLDSATYEIFEGDPVKYNQYERAIKLALSDWSRLRKPTSSPRGSVVIAVAGSGRGPLVTRALAASAATGVPVELWAVEKNPNAYVYLLRQNEKIWNGRVQIVKTDMRAWKGPLLNPLSNNPVEQEKYGKVDILVSELLGSFGDNELSPECLDGIQHVLAPDHGISIPRSYTSHLSPISTPRLHADIASRIPADPNAFDTPWVVRLYAIDFVSAKGVPDHARFQCAWEFEHPIPKAVLETVETKRSSGAAGGGGGAMACATGMNDHNSRHCHLTFVCRVRGVIHGLAGYFESVLYEKESAILACDKKDEMEEDEEFDGNREVREKVELSILPEMMDHKNPDMISWFPIFFPLKKPLYFPADAELEVSMWRQTDDSKVWYEWLVEAFTWIGPKSRIKVASSDLCSSRKVACLM